MAGLLQEWLRVWAEPSASSSLLHEPALAALLVYGRLMRSAYNEPTFGRNEAPYARARAFVDELLGGAGHATAFAEALAQGYPRAYENLRGKGDFLRGCSEEAKLLLPDVDGECGR